MSFVAEQTGQVSVSGGLHLVADARFEDDVTYDWVFCPPMWGTPWSVISRQSKAQSWLQSQYASGCRIVATGTGVGHVAQAGLLDQRVATTHWYYNERFAKRFSDIQFEADHFITHQDGIYCAGSINAQTELVLYFIEREFGEDSLALVERQFMHEIKRSFTTPYYEPGGHIHDDEVVSLVQSWIRGHFSDHITIAQLAEVAGQSERQLRRRFVAATGESPISYMTGVRIEEAQSLLRQTNLTVMDIAIAVGYTNAAYFSKAFKQVTSLTPGNYRKMVRKKQFSDVYGNSE